MKNFDMYNLIKPLLFRLDAEVSHNITMAILSKVSHSPAWCKMLRSIQGISNIPQQQVEAMGLRFKNPLGLAAGLDKQAVACDAFANLGFGFIELGTVTPLPQAGNTKPRLFRLTQNRAIINHLGFNSVGIDSFVNNCSKIRSDIIKGINIGKNSLTPLENAHQDYLTAMRVVYQYADYIAINISSPNTKNLRDLHSEQALDFLLSTLDGERALLADKKGKPIPIAIKVSPDIEKKQIETIAKLLRRHHVDALIATNTTTSRFAATGHSLSRQTGGLSGAPLRQQSTKIIAAFYQNLQDEIPIIGVGGIDSAEAAIEKIQSGAKLIQAYTGLIYQGPKLVKDILKGLQR